MTPKDRRKYFNLCDPETPVGPDDGRAVDIDEFGAKEGQPVRGDRWVEDLAYTLRLSETPRCELLTGLPGSGKSSLLRRVIKELEKPADPLADPPFLCVMVNAEQWIDPASPVDVTEILLAMLYETERRVLEVEGDDPEKAAREGVIERVWSSLTKTEVMLKGINVGPSAEVGVPGLAKGSAGFQAMLELKTDPTLREQVRRLASHRMHNFLSEVRHYFKILWTRAAKAKDGYPGGIVVIVDSLEKLRGININFDEVLQSAERLFAQGAPHLFLADRSLGREAPRVHALYTVPPALALRRAIHELKFLPMIKLQSRDGKRYEPGYLAARALIRQRVPDEILSDVFGAEALEAQCERLIAWSGGYPREIVRLLRECVKQSQRVDGAMLSGLLSNAAEAYRRTVTVEAAAWLVEVRAKHDLLQKEGNVEHQRMIDRALSDNLVLRYKNHDDWFSLHPALEGMRLLEQTEAAKSE